MYLSEENICISIIDNHNLNIHYKKFLKKF